MNELAYTVASLVFALGAWDAFRRYVERLRVRDDAENGRILAHDKSEAFTRELTAVNARLKMMERQMDERDLRQTALQGGVDECIVRLDVIKGQHVPTRAQLSDLEEHTRKELRALDDECRKLYQRVETQETAINTTAAVTKELAQRVTGFFSTQTGKMRVGA